MRGAAATVVVLALAACGKGRDTQPAPVPTKTEENHVSCAPAGARDFAPACTREIAQSPDGETWVIRHPNGGFRRFVLIDGGKRIATADGADEVAATRIGSDLEVRVANDRYRFPAAADAAAR
ncbi:MAG: hypothetical protein EOO76_01215 [Novosphingobium sp.]|nr:MAG: hypothetical protein EOO76_01215 [Novosphingobium sp.]